MTIDEALEILSDYCCMGSREDESTSAAFGSSIYKVEDALEMARQALREKEEPDNITLLRLIMNNSVDFQKYLELHHKIMSYFENYESEKEPCAFCRVFDFSSARTQVDKYGARVSLALSTTRFDREEQFNYCPVCGRRRNE